VITSAALVIGQRPERRQVADAAFSAIASVNERLKHDKVVRAWVKEYERSEQA
jgi:hypothetical protein